MKKPTQIMSLIVFVLVQLGLSELAVAQKIKVKKTKGNTALVETSVPLEEGQTYDLQTGVISADVNYSQAGFKSRQHSLTVGMDFSMLKGDTVQENSFSFQGRYGWNFSYLEFGVVGELGYVDVGAGAVTNFSFGGYFDYNLISNRDSRSFIYGPFALISFGSRQLNGGGSTGLFTINAGGFFSYFIAQNSTALRLEGFVDYRQVNATVGQASLTGFGSRGLLVFYF